MFVLYVVSEQITSWHLIFRPGDVAQWRHVTGTIFTTTDHSSMRDWGFSSSMLNVRERFKEQGPCLYICSTPIGNLGDASFRLLDVLRQVDVIAAEDTRHTRKLLTHFDIHPNELISYHQHNQASRKEDLIRWWTEGKTIALVSDAGTPGVSDPGEDAVAIAIEHHVPVVPVPGPSAVLAALTGSGFPIQPFAFQGFLPRDKKQSESILRALAPFHGTVVFYEAPHRLKRTIQILSEPFAGREVCLARELTKRYETFVSGDFEEIIGFVEENEPRGEYVIIVGPRQQTDVHGDDSPEDAAHRLQSAVEEVHALQGEGISHKEAVQRVSERTGVHRKTLYQSTLKSK